MRFYKNIASGQTNYKTHLHDKICKKLFLVFGNAAVKCQILKIFGGNGFYENFESFFVGKLV